MNCNSDVNWKAKRCAKCENVKFQAFDLLKDNVRSNNDL